MSWTPGNVLVVKEIKKFDLPDEGAFAIVLDEEDAMLFFKAECGVGGTRREIGWRSGVEPLADLGDDTRLAGDDEVPDDVPADFWPLSARSAMR